jgi:hypothetical protein
MAKEKDKTEVGITGKPVPKPKTAKQQYELEKRRRERRHLGRNVGGTQYSSDVNPYFNPRSVREEVLSYLLDEGFASDEKSAEAIMGAMSEAWIESIVEEVLDEAVLGARKGHIRSVIAKGGGPGSIKYVASGGDIVANDRAAQERASDKDRKKAGKNRANAARYDQALKKGIERATNRSGRTDGFAPNSSLRQYERDDETFTNRNARRRRASGR